MAAVRSAKQDRRNSGPLPVRFGSGPGSRNPAARTLRIDPPLIGESQAFRDRHDCSPVLHWRQGRWIRCVTTGRDDRRGAGGRPARGGAEGEMRRKERSNVGRKQRVRALSDCARGNMFDSTASAGSSDHAKCIAAKLGARHILMAITLSEGRPDDEVTGLNDLWDRLEQDGVRIAVDRDRRNPERTLLTGISAGNVLLEFAQSKVPDLAEETKRGLSTLEPTGGRTRSDGEAPANAGAPKGPRSAFSRPGDLFCATSPERPFANPYLSCCCTRRTTTADSTGDGFPPSSAV